MGDYRYLDHTADLGVEIEADTLEALFITAGRAIFETQIRGPVALDREIVFELNAESLEDLFIDWCRELLYRFSVQGFIPHQYNLAIAGFRLKAVIKGGSFDPAQHAVKLEIKNPTYHDLKIEKLPDLYRATIVFDV
jgi:SHS2 domain-containing protein